MLIGKGDEQPFVEAMLELERNPAIRKRIVDNAFSICYQDYRIEAIAHRFLAEYERIIAAHPPSQR
jgi:glycosyltransferase involved in cell wall biosynthesis